VAQGRFEGTKNGKGSWAKGTISKRGESPSNEYKNKSTTGQGRRHTHTHTHTHSLTLSLSHWDKEKELGKSGQLGFGGMRLPGKLFEVLAPPPCPSWKKTKGRGEDEKSMLRWFKV